MKIEEARAKAIEYGLDGPDWALDIKKHISIIRNRIGSTGGCGPGKWGDWLVPDTIYLVNIKPSCYVHDCEYSEAETEEDRHNADIRLFENGDKIIKLKSKNRFILWLRRRRLKKYYAAVDIAGSSFTS